MSFQKEKWTDQIQEKLFAGLEFVRDVLNHDDFVDNNTVHIPQASRAISAMSTTSLTILQ